MWVLHATLQENMLGNKTKCCRQRAQERLQQEPLVIDYLGEEFVHHGVPELEAAFGE